MAADRSKFISCKSQRSRRHKFITFLASMIPVLCGVATADPGTGVIRVRAFDLATGQPIASAQAAVTRDNLPSHHADGFRRPVPDRLQVRTGLPAQAADETGSAVFDGLDAGNWLIEVWADGYVKESREILLGMGPARAELDFHLQRGTTIEGAVHDSDGNPLPGALIAVSTPPQRLLAVVASDGDGAYRLPPLPRNMKLLVRVSASQPGYESTSESLSVTDATLRHDVVLAQRPRGRAVRGLVVDRAGEPVVGAAVEHYLSGAQGEPRRVTTDDNGRFLFDDLNGDPPELVVRAAGLKIQHVDVRSGSVDEPADMTVALEPGYRSVGHVVDERNRPLAGADVAFFGDAGPQPLTRFLPPYGVYFGAARTDDEGRFEFDSLPATCRADISKAGYVTIAGEPIKPSEAGELRLIMEPRPAVRLRVIDAASRQPLAHYNLRIGEARPASPPTRDAVERRSPQNTLLHQVAALPALAVYSSDGICQMSDLPAPARLEAIVDAPGHVRQYSQPFEPSQLPNDAPVEVALEAEVPEQFVHYRGRLIDDTGAAVPQAELRLIVFISRPEEMTAMSRPGRIRPRRQSGNTPSRQGLRARRIRDGSIADEAHVIRFEKATSDAEGYFVFPGVPRTRQIAAAWWRHGIAMGIRAGLETLSDEEALQLTLEAQPAASVVLRVDHKVYPGRLSLTISGGDREFINFSVPAEQEVHEIDDLSAGSYHIRGGVLRGDPGRYVELFERTFDLARGERLELDVGEVDRTGD